MTQLTINDGLTHVWVYNVCVHKDEPHLLVTRRKGYENLFWHLASGRIITPPDSFPGVAMCEIGGIVANDCELGFTLNDMKSVKGDLVHKDKTADSSWIEGVGCAHVLMDWGQVDKLPEPNPQVVETDRGPKGVVFAKWAKLSDIVVDWNRARDLTAEQIKDYPLCAAASQHVFLDGFPLRSMAAKVLSQYIVPEITFRYEPFPKSIAYLADSRISRTPERRPVP